jgi:hypothetical protein
VAQLVEAPKEFGELRMVWAFEDAELPLLDDLKERLSAGEFKSQTEIATFYGKSPPTGRAYLDRGIRAGMWTEDEVAQWIGKGRYMRKDGRTKAPIRPHSEWRDDKPEEGDIPRGGDGEIAPF